MNEEKLWEEIENCLEYDNDIYGGDSVFLHTTSIENLMDWFKNKEANLLKDFVEWMKVNDMVVWHNGRLQNRDAMLDDFIKERDGSAE